MLDAKSKFSLIRQTYKNIASGWLSILLIAGVNIIVTPVLLNELGKELYGLWFIVFNLLTYFYIADFGVTSAITRLYAKYKISSPNNIRELISTSYILVICIDALSILFIFLYSDDIFNYLEINDKYYKIYSFLILVAIFELGTQFILRVNIGILKGLHRYDTAYKLESFSAVLRLSLVFLLLTLDSFDVYSFAIVYSGSKIVADSLSIYFVKNTLKEFRLIVDKKVVKELLDIGSSSIISSVASTLMNSLPILLFGKFFGIESIFLYSIPFAIMIILTRLTNSIYHGLTPRSSELKAMNNLTEIHKISSFSIKVAITIGFLFLSFFSIFGDSLMHYWLGNETLLESDFIVMNNIFLILLVYLFMETIVKANVFIYKATGLHWAVTIESVLSVFIMYISSYTLYDLLHEYVFSVALLFVGVFKFIYYKLVARNRIDTYSISVGVLIINTLYIIVLFLINNTLNLALLSQTIFWFLSITLYFVAVYAYLFSSNEAEKIKTNFLKSPIGDQ